MCIRDSLQTMWYENQLGIAHLRKKEWGPAFRQFKFIEKHFLEIQEDQYDFHTYCLRKYTLREYIQLIKYVDNVYNNKQFIICATNMIKGLMEYKVIKDNQLKEDIEEQKTEKKKLTQAEKKKLKKQEQQQKQQQEEQKNDKLDLKGVQYLKEELKDIYEEAMNFAKKVIGLEIKDKKIAFNAFLTVFDLYLELNKIPLAIRAYKKLQNNNFNPSQVHKRKIQLLKACDKFFAENQNYNQMLKEILSAEINEINSSNIQEFNEKNKKSLEGQIILVQCQNLKFEEEKNAVEKIVLSVPAESIEEGVYALKELEKIESGEETIKKAKEQFSQQYPLCKYFK
eukprot:TRINITY_DN11116_c0_g1_i2.p1 TRINITY_DN11116_c0_g1~~TRINITY_DN11116_c0_g1_i2.p1  ORF type:complete len:340 (-),score=96.54 TRINITY_DN11116_c0_g1_i2:77-1096(-)